MAEVVDTEALSSQPVFKCGEVFEGHFPHRLTLLVGYV